MKDRHNRKERPVSVVPASQRKEEPCKGCEHKSPHHDGLTATKRIIETSERQIRQHRKVAAIESGTVQKKGENLTGMPDQVKNQAESALKADFSGVRIYPNSAKAPQVGAVAYAQGTDIHFAPGSYNPHSSTGRSLLGHELTHVVQQAQGRVKPTTNVGGVAVNDDTSLEQEADRLGSKI